MKKEKKIKFSDSEEEHDEDDENNAPAPIKKEKNKDLKNNNEFVKKLYEKENFILDNINFLEDNRTDIELHNGDEKIKELIEEFKNKYYTYKDIKRFSIPVIGCISSGKSTILNYLLNLKKILQVAHKITTKCICIIRHRKGCKKAKIFNVDIKSRGDGLYNFEIKKKKKKLVKKKKKMMKLKKKK